MSRVPAVPTARRSSLPLSWSSREGTLDAWSHGLRVPGTFVRAGRGAIGAMTDGSLLAHPATNDPVWEIVTARDGITRLGLRICPAFTNHILHPDFGAGWTAVGTPTRVAAALNLGTVALDLLGDDTGSAVEGYSQQIQAISGATGVRYGSFLIAQGTSTSTVIRGRIVAGADVLRLRVTWSSGAPVITMTTGALVGIRQLTATVWQIVVETTAMNPANNHEWLVYPATDASLATAPTGTVYLGGVMVTNTAIPCPLVLNGGTMVATANESLTWPVTVARSRIASPWLYLAFTELGSRYVVGAAGGYAALGDPLASGTGLAIYPNSFIPGIAGLHWVNGSGGIGGVATWPTFLDYVEVLLTLDATGAPRTEVAFNGVSQGSGVGGSVADATTPFSNAVARLGAFGASGGWQATGALYHEFRVGLTAPPGSLAEARMRR